MSDVFESARPEVRRDGYGRYMLPPINSPRGKLKAYTRATTFAGAITDTYALGQWQQRMVALGLAQRRDLLARVASLPTTLGKDDKATLQQLAEEAKEHAGAKVGANTGTAMHSFTERVDRGEITLADIEGEPWEEDITGYVRTIREHGLCILPSLTERIVVVSKFGVAGTLDRIVQLTRSLCVETPRHGRLVLPAGTWVVLDLKTGQSIDFSWLANSVQLALYNHAQAMWDPYAGNYDPMPEPLEKRVAFVLHLPAGKNAPRLYPVDTETGWEHCSLIEQVRAARSGASKLAGTVTMGDTESPSLRDKVLSCTTVAELSALWAANRGAWTDDLTALGRNHILKGTA